MNPPAESTLRQEPRDDRVARLRGEMIARWRSGDRVPVEQYLTQFPDLSDDDALVLIFGEVVLRWESGEAPTPEEYIGRFSKFADVFSQQFELEQALRGQAKTLDGSATLRQPGGTPAAANIAPPGFEILGELGRGGMGVVYHARQTKLNRDVALKMILTGGHADEMDRARFLAEANAIAALNHPGIVQVYEFGTHEGQPYFALEYCPGGSLAKRLNGTPLPPKDAATLVQKLAYAVHAAHEKGIVHRDLKPANVLLTRTITAEGAESAEKITETGLSTAFSAVSAVKISDFGLAKRLESGSDLTKSGAIVGTPSYMAPEQARGGGKNI